MGEPLHIIINAPHQRWLPGGGAITFDHASTHHGVWMRHWDAQDHPLELRELTYDEYEQFRKAHPELDMPQLRPRQPGENANGNTVGKVVGRTLSASGPASKANPIVQAETPAEAGTGAQILDGVQLGLDVVGLIPGFGEIADLANAGISALRGDFVSAGLSLAAAIPFVGWGGTAAKGVRRGVKAVEAATQATTKAGKEVLAEGTEQALKHGDEVAAGTKKADEAKRVAGGSGGGKVEGKPGGNGKGDDICKVLASLIYGQAVVLTKRILDLKLDKLNLFKIARDRPHASLPKGSGSWDGHVHQAEGVQNGLRRDIKRYDAAKCKEPKIPKQARDLAYAKIPSRPDK